jgi:thiosulfate reductase cytochrome b subunit
MESSAMEARRSVAARSFFQNHPEAGTQSPLSKDLREGLIAISVFSVLSFVLCTVLWLYLTYKLISWRIRWRSRARMIAKNLPEPPILPTLDSYIGGGNTPGDAAKIMHQRNIQAIRDAERESPNQFLILIYNLFLADMHQATGFLISTVWLSRDGLIIHTPACFAQGLFNCVGDLATSCFIAMIAAHTYMSVVRDYQPPQRILYASIIFIWLFVYLLPGFSILGTMNGRSIDGFFAVTGAWVSANAAVTAASFWPTCPQADHLPRISVSSAKAT